MKRQIIGPRVPKGDWARNPVRYGAPSALLVLAAVCLLVSLAMPYWRMTLHAPQYPGGLHVRAYLYKLTGDVGEIDGLNHYIGMRKLDEAAKLEREIGVYALLALSLLVVAGVYIHNRKAAYLAFPAVVFPFLFLADLHFWLRDFGLNLDPKAPLSSSIKPFVPPVLGEGKVGQFRTVAWPDTGLILALTASVLIVAALYFHRRAYKPLVAGAAAPEETGEGRPGGRTSRPPQTRTEDR